MKANHNCPYIETMNPEEFRNSSGRIVRKVEGKSVDMIYIKTFGAEISADDTAHSLLFTQVEDEFQFHKVQLKG